MDELFTIFVLVVLLLAAVVLAAMVLSQRRQLGELRRELLDTTGRLAGLTERVWRLEGSSGRTSPPAPVAAVTPAVEAHPRTAELPHIPAVAPAPKPRQDWETLVGTNWLNRLGALILVIGIVLFLGYSLTLLGPGGRIAIGLTVGASLLTAGIALTRQPAYRSLAFSLMAAGWALLYLTAYAAYALPAARVIESPAVAFGVLFVVAAGMIAHALGYRSEEATGLAYLFGFIGLNVTPLTSFSVAATVLLALSLVGVSLRFAWFRLPVLGIILTYTTYVLRRDMPDFGHSALWIYWLAFEAYDLIDTRRRGRSARSSYALFVMNAIGFAGAALLHDWRLAPHDWSVFLMLAAVAYGLSAAVRSGWARGDSGSNAIEGGGTEGAIAFASLFLAGAFVERFSGTSITLALLFEAELLLVAGIAMGSRWLRRWGSLMLVFPLVHLMVDAVHGGTLVYAGRTWRRWTPVGALTGLVLVGNRIALRSGWYFTAAAAVVIGAVAIAELPDHAVAPFFALAGLALLGVWRRLGGSSDLRWAGLASLLAGFITVLVVNVSEREVPGTAVVCAALYAAAPVGGVSGYIRGILSVLGTFVVTCLVAQKAPIRLITVAWAVEAAVVLVAGFSLGDRVLRLSGLALFCLCLIRLFVYDFHQLDTIYRILSFVILGVVLLGASWFYTRFRDKVNKLL